MTRRALLLLLAAAAASACTSNEPDERVVGQLASDRIELSAEFAEPVSALPVAEGSPVSRGDVLVRLDSRRAEARLAEAGAALAEARARLDEAVRGPREEQIAAARASLAGAERQFAFRAAELERIREIRAKGLASADTLDTAQAAFDAAAAELEVRRAALDEALSGTTVEALAQIEAAVAAAEARQDLAQVDLERHTLTAPADGVADTRLLELGERPQPGQPVFVMLAGAQPHARIYVPEPLRTRVRPGTPVLVHVDGRAEPIPGRVRWVASEAAFTPYFALTEHDRGRLSYEAKVDLDIGGTADRLPDGVPVEVEIDLSGGSGE